MDDQDTAREIISIHALREEGDRRCSGRASGEP